MLSSVKHELTLLNGLDMLSDNKSPYRQDAAGVPIQRTCCCLQSMLSTCGPAGMIPFSLPSLRMHCTLQAACADTCCLQRATHAQQWCRRPSGPWAMTLAQTQRARPSMPTPGTRSTSRGPLKARALRYCLSCTCPVSRGFLGLAGHHLCHELLSAMVCFKVWKSSTLC